MVMYQREMHIGMLFLTMVVFVRAVVVMMYGDMMTIVVASRSMVMMTMVVMACAECYEAYNGETEFYELVHFDCFYWLR